MPNSSMPMKQSILANFAGAEISHGRACGNLRKGELSFRTRYSSGHHLCGAARKRLPHSKSRSLKTKTLGLLVFALCFCRVLVHLWWSGKSWK